MIHNPGYLANYRSVTDAYGYWPDFHDSPVLRFLEDGDSIEMDVKAWEMTSETDERGYFKLIKKHVVGFRFSGIVSKDLDRFARENILFSLGFSSCEEYRSSGHFPVVLDSAMGGDLCGSFCAGKGEVAFLRAVEE